MTFDKKRTKKQHIDLQIPEFSGLGNGDTGVLPPARMYTYDSELYDETSIDSLEKIEDAVKNKSATKVLWIDIEG